MFFCWANVVAESSRSSGSSGFFMKENHRFVVKYIKSVRETHYRLPISEVGFRNLYLCKNIAMQSTAKTPQEYIDSLPPGRKEAISKIPRSIAKKSSHWFWRNNRLWYAGLRGATFYLSKGLPLQPEIAIAIYQPCFAKEFYCFTCNGRLHRFEIKRMVCKRIFEILQNQAGYGSRLHKIQKDGRHSVSIDRWTGG